MKRVLVAAGVALFSMSAAYAADVALSVEGGTTGLGLHLSMPVAKDLNARVGFNGLNYNYSGTTSDASYDFKLKLQTVDALLDWFPMTDNSFRVTGGLVYNGTKADATATPTAAGTYTFNGVTYSAANVGVVNGKIDFRKVAPYLGIGWGNALAKQSGGWSFQSDLGILFQGSPTTSLTSSGCTAPAGANTCTTLATDLAKENASFQDKANNLRAYPVIRIGVGYKF